MGDQRTDDLTVAETPLADPTGGTAAAPRPWGTVWVWLLAFMPWVVAVCAVLGLLRLWSTGMSIALDQPQWIWVPLLIGPYLVSVALAALDARRLTAWQHPTVAPWAWAFLGGPVYLVARSFALEPRARGSLRPMWVGLANAAVATGVTLVGLGVVVALAAYFLSLMAASYNTTVF